MSGHSGQVLSDGRSSTFGLMLICTTCLAPCRCAVATQSAPVSPPPRTTTFLPGRLSFRQPCVQPDGGFFWLNTPLSKRFPRAPCPVPALREVALVRSLG